MISHQLPLSIIRRNSALLTADIILICSTKICSIHDFHSPFRSEIYTGHTQKNDASSKDAPHKNNVFFKPCSKLALHCNHRSGHLKTEHTESLLLLLHHLGNWSLGPAVNMRSDLRVAHEDLGQFPLRSVDVVPV
jgi:hypothetical protein